MTNIDRQSRFIGQFLQFHFPQTHPRTVGAATIGGDGQLRHARITFPSHFFQPSADRSHGKLRGITGNPNADPGTVIIYIVHAIRRDLAKFLVRKIMSVDALRLAFGAIIAATIFVIADQLLFFVSTEMIGCPASCTASTCSLMCSNWASRSGCSDPSFALRLN